jgi:hypothetical protein
MTDSVGLATSARIRPSLRHLRKVPGCAKRFKEIGFKKPQQSGYNLAARAIPDLNNDD